MANPVLFVLRNRFAAERMQRQFSPDIVRVIWAFHAPLTEWFKAAYVAPPEDDVDLEQYAEWINVVVRTHLMPGCQGNFMYL
jgi:hypothetical protein